MNCAAIGEFDIDAMKDALRDHGTNLVFAERPRLLESSAVADAVSRLEKPLQVWFVDEHVDRPEERIDTAIREHGGDPKQWLAITSDVAGLYRQFIGMTGDRQPFLSFRVVDSEYLSKEASSVSSEWHRDSAVLTLFTTYLGLGTQWTLDSNVKRDYFVAHQKQRVSDRDEIFLHDTTLVMTTSLYGVGILKGEMKSGDEDEDRKEFLSNFSSVDYDLDFNVGGGLIHRGPARVSADRRLLLTISTFTVPPFLSQRHQTSQTLD